MKTQLESQLNPSADEREAEKKAKQKRRRKKPAAQASQVPQSSSQNTAGAAPEAPAPTQPPKKKRTSPYPGQVMPSLFSRRAGISSAGSAAASDKAAEAAPAGGKKKKQPSKTKSAQPQKLPITPAPSALTSPAALGRQSSPKRKAGAAVRIISLGGLHEIGKNMTVIEYGADIVVVDCGLAFPEDNMLGVDLVIPDMSYIESNKDKLRGLFITHGHEDHIGAVPYFLKKFDVPVYGTRLTLGIIEGKFEEHDISGADLVEVKAGQTIKAGAFSVEFIKVNHSIADACALCITTPVGRVVHTGDFKIDLTPLNGEPIDLARFAELGTKGVRLLLCDSTNAERSGYTPTEKIVSSSLDRIFMGNEKRVVVATFSSNIYRVQQIINASAKNGRKVAVTGRSMLNILSAATRLGYMDIPDGLMIDVTDMKRYKPSQLTLITTGSQGEPMSALYRMAFGGHAQISLGPNDLVVLSSSSIPGNEKAISNIINELYKRGVNVLDDNIADVHVSGHACREELKLIHALVKPDNFVPVHGEYRHLVKHAALARELGMPDNRILIPETGRVIELDKRSMRFGQTVPSGQILVDGYGVGDVGTSVLRDRKHLAEDGILIIVAAIDFYTNTIVSGPDITSRGFVYVKEAEALMEEVHKACIKIIERCLKRGAKDVEVIKTRMKDELAGMIVNKTKRKPMILPLLMTADL